MVKHWFIGDTHFGHENIIQYTKRPYKDAKDMDRQLVRRWNETVKDDDIVYMMGDFSLDTKEKIIEIGQRLKGRKILIKGNHDIRPVDLYLHAGFEQVMKKPIIIMKKYILSHQPILDMNLGDFINIYAHTHNNKVDPTFEAKNFCTSVELIDYKPISLDKIEEKFL